MVTEAEAAVKLHPEAHALSAARLLRGGELRLYTATTFPRDPWAGCAQFVRIASYVGYLEDPVPDDNPYAILDVLNENGDIVQDFAVPNERAWRWIERKLDLRVVDVSAPGAAQETVCTGCGCSEHRACVHISGMTCSWVMPGLCSACVPGASGWTHPKAQKERCNG